jgi:hypothetical protein
LQETLTRLGGKMPFEEAVEEFWFSHHTAVGEATCRRITYRNGGTAEAWVCQEAIRLEKEGFDETEGPTKLVISADGSFIRLTNGEWREVKGLAVGEFETVDAALGMSEEVKTQKLSYFTRSYRVRDFETFALPELARRGLGEAETVVAVNDGAEWLQSFINYHCPTAVRILDFAHALGYVAEAGKVIWSAEADTFKSWFEHCSHQLKHKPPQRTLAELSLLLPKAQGDEQATVIDNARFYLQRRLDMIDYPYFRRRGYPIGSGSVESAHKQVVQRRMKQAGMRWAPQHVNPILALRDLLCSGRWSEGWDNIVAFQLQQQREKRCQRALAKQPSPSPPLTFSALQAAGLLPTPDAAEERPLAQKKPKRDPKDHPWRRNLWPTKESWRWSKYRQQK